MQRDTQGAPEDMLNPPDCGSDFSVPVVAGVQIVKSVNGADANAGTGVAVAVGSTVTWTFQVRNTGSAALAIVSVVDDNGTPGTAADDFLPLAVTALSDTASFNVGDIDHDNLLDVGETWLYAATGTATAGAYVNLATVTARNPTSNQTYTDTDPARYFGLGTQTATIRIEKAINAADPRNPTLAEDADIAPGPTLQVGTPITWTYQVFNDGTAPIQITSIRDDSGTPGATRAADDFTPAAVLNAGFNIGDADRDNLLDPGEAWRFTSAGTGTYLAVAGAYKNIATVTGTVGGTVVQDDDPVYYFGSQSASVVSVRLEKAVNAVDPNAPTAYEDADFLTGPILQVGSTVVWTYQLFNTGNVAVSMQSLRDDAGTISVTADDFSPAAVLATGTPFNVGDLDRDNLVDVSEVWRYRATGTVSVGQYTNKATVSVIDQVSAGTATAFDLANHFGSRADVQVVKAVNAINPLAPTATEDANNPATPVLLPAGTTVLFTYAVRNTDVGNTPLKTVTLVDDGGTVGVPGDDFVPAPVTVTFNGQLYNTGDINRNNLLEKTETWLYTATRVVGEGAYTNYAAVTAFNNSTNVMVMDDDPANIFGAVARIDVEKAINAADPRNPTVAEDADDPNQPVVLNAGSAVTWTYLLSNTGNGPLTVNSLRDDAGTPGVAADDFTPLAVLSAGFNLGDVNRNSLLDIGEVWSYTSAGTTAASIAQAGLHTNMVTAVGTDTRTARTATDTDNASYRGKSLTIRIEKAINAADPTRPTAAEDADGAPGPTLEVGTPITWTYQVFNEGAAPIASVLIVDDFGTPSNVADDFVPAAVLAAGTGFNIGDLDRDSLLDFGEVWRFTSAGTPQAGSYQAVVGAYKNVATVTGSVGGVSVQDDDPANYLGVRTPPVVSVRLEKAVNAVNPNAPTAYEDADAATGPILPVGSTVVWTYQLFNAGNVAVSVTSLRDDAGTPANAADDFTPAAVLAAGTVFNVGDLDRDNLVDVNEGWLYRATGTVIAGQYTNKAAVNVRDPGSASTATANDPANYFGSPVGVQVVKAVNAVRPLAPTTTEDANNAATPVLLPAGTSVVFTYAVRNTSNAALKTVTLVDDNGTVGNTSDDFVPAPVTIIAGGKVYNTGDVNKDGLLDRTETWLYSATRAVGEGAYSNYATVSAVNSSTNVTVWDDDPANIFGTVARIDVEKAINAANPRNPTVAEDADSAANPVKLNVGTSLTWTYLLSNSGNGPLTVTSIRDDAATPGVTTDDFTPAPVLNAGFNVGDNDRDNLLDVGEVWSYTSVGTTAFGSAAELGLHTNIVTAVGSDARTARTATDTDAASYLGQTGAIRIEKAVNAIHPDAPTRFEDADFPTGPYLQVGAPVVWTYQLFNQSGVALDIIDLRDSDNFMPTYVGGDVGPNGGVADGIFGPEEVWLFTSAGVTGAPTTALAGQRSNTATVVAIGHDSGVRFTDDDQANYFGTTTGVSIVKAINAVNPSSPTVREDANDPVYPVTLLSGSVPTFTFQVRNTGTSALKDITIVDDALTNVVGDDFKPVAVMKAQWNVGDTNTDGLLNPGETWRYTSAGVYTTAPLQGTYINVAQVTATNVLTGTKVSDDDPANFVIALPAHTDGRMTGGGSIFTADDRRVTHGFELHCDSTIGPNNLEVNWDRNNFHLEQVTAMACYDDPLLNPLPRPAPFDTLVGTGTGRFNGVSGYTVSFKFTDNGEPGTTDLAQIEIRDPQGRLVLFVSGNLHNGNQQAHPENKLQAAAAPAVTAANAASVEVSQLFASFAQAKLDWAASGVSAEQIARLDTIRLAVADLPGLVLGQAENGVVTIDANAAGWGWFVDRTPQDSREFVLQGGVLVASSGPAAGHMDLLTVLTHELGHVLGLAHADAGVMAGELTVGVREPAPGASVSPTVVVNALPAAALTVFDRVAPPPAIDWSKRPLAAAMLRSVATAEPATAPSNWQARFVNHLGATPERVNPNAALRLQMPLTPKLSAL